MKHASFLIFIIVFGSIVSQSFIICVSGQSGGYYSTVPHYNQDWHTGSGDCLPNSAAQVLGFHDQQDHTIPSPWPRLIPKGCSSFASNPNGYNTTMNALKNAMDWWNNPGKVPAFGWLWDAVGNQVKNASASLDPGASGWWVDDDEFTTWNNMTNQLNNYGPMMFMVITGNAPYYYGSLSSPSDGTSDGTITAHSMCMVGWYDGNKAGINTRWVIVDMGWSGTAPAWINYDYSILKDFYTVEIRTTGSHYTTDPLDTPTGVSASDGNYNDRVQISWSSVTGATDYEIWRNTSNSIGSATLLNNVSGVTTYDDAGAIPGTTYYYWVRAKYSCSGSSGNSGYSNSNSGYRACLVPGITSGVTVSDGDYCDIICIAWNSVSGATSYDIYRGSTFITNTTSTNYCFSTVNTTSTQYCIYARNICGLSTSPGCDYGYTTRAPSQPGPISGNSNACQGSSQTYSISSVAGASSYSWTLPSGWSGNSTSTSITTTVGTTGGTISVTANNSCGSSSSPRTLSVTVPSTPSQPGPISGNSNACQGSSQTYSISSVAGASSYSWTLPSGWSGNSTSTSITTTVGTTGGTISVTANNSCGSSSSPRTLSVTVPSTPSQPGPISGNSNACQGSSQTYSISSVAGASSYSWTLPSGWSGNSTSTSITTTVGTTGGTISVTANNSCGSSSSPRTLSVTVPSTPSQPGPISGNSNACQGSSQTYSISSVAGASSYSWTLPSGWSGNSTSTSITTTVGTTGGTISVTANNSCGSSSSPRTLSVTVPSTPSQPGPISGNSNACQGSSQTYSISSVAGASSYSWTLPSGWSGNSTSTSITTTVGTTGGTISVTANNSCGSSSSPRTLSVTVPSTPSQPGPISGNSNACQGSSQTYSISSVAGASSYSWTLPSGWSGNSTSTSITTTVGTTGGTISVTANNSCGSSSSPRTLSVTVPSTPSQPGPISGNSNACQGSSQTYSISSVAGASSYSWTLPSGWSGNSTSTSITTTVGTTGGTISVTANNSCGSSSSPRTLSVTVPSTPSQPGPISGNSNACQGSSQTYSISSVAGATSYTWTYSGGGTPSGIGTSCMFVPTSSGTLAIIANNSCGSSIARTISISVSQKPSIITSSIIDATQYNATGGGNVTSDGGSLLTAMGVCWNITGNPTIADFKTSDGASIGSFSSTLFGLIDGNYYFIRAYATNICGTEYGQEMVYLHNPSFIEDIIFQEVKLYPNPVSGILNIEYQNDSFKSVKILNSQGRLLHSEKVVIPKQRIDFSGFEQGLFILEFINSSGGSKRVKVLKSR